MLRALSIVNEMDVVSIGHHTVLFQIYDHACTLLSQLYRQLSIRVVLTEAITWTNGDRFTVDPDPNTLLNTFRTEQRNVISSQYDSAMLMTYV